MKKIIAGLLSAGMLLGLLSGCGQAASSSAPADAGSAPASVQETPAAAPAQTPEPQQETASAAEASAEDAAPQIAAQNFDIPMPLTEEPVTFTYFMLFNPQVQDWCQDMSDNLFYKTLEEKSGVHIEFQLFHPMNFGEQFNLQMASQDYADFYCEAATGYTGGYDKGVEDEVFLDLTPYIEEYAPNYNAIINMNDQNRRDALTDEGRVVFFAAAYDDGQPCIKGPMIRADWAKEFGMDPAEINTYDEYEQYIEQAYNTYGATVQLPMSGEPGFGYLTAGFGTLVPDRWNALQRYFVRGLSGVCEDGGRLVSEGLDLSRLYE